MTRLVALLIVAAGAALAAPPLPDWSRPAPPHPLTGQILRLSDGALLSADALAAELATADFVLLGELHDNDDHHLLQAWIVATLAASGRPGAVAFEMIGADEAPALGRYLTEHPGDAAGLGDAVGWERRGWPRWDRYQPIAEAALAAGYALVAGGAARDQTRRVRDQGLAGLDAADRDRMDLGGEWRGDYAAALTDDLDAGHCGQLPASLLPGMVAAQRLTDATLADRLIASRPAGGVAILIAGAGHTRRDRGVALYLRARQKAAHILALAFVEAQPGREDARTYAADLYGRSVMGEPAFDLIWFTPPRGRAGGCAPP